MWILSHDTVVLTRLELTKRWPQARDHDHPCQTDSTQPSINDRFYKVSLYRCRVQQNKNVKQKKHEGNKQCTQISARWGVGGAKVARGTVSRARAHLSHLPPLAHPLPPRGHRDGAPGGFGRALLTHAMAQHLALSRLPPPISLSRLPRSSAVTRPQEWANDLLLFLFVVAV
ncbi:hypothetical protein TNCV_67561 [Trichonephila clavipes]|nr:hypothetical protein TNCV_67561 [Trichonephila clavipes]